MMAICSQFVGSFYAIHTKEARMLEKWKKAVVHLECARDSESRDENRKRTRELIDLMRKGEITEEACFEAMNSGYRDVRHHGTALFISHEGRRYLLTARHVLFNGHDAELDIREAEKTAMGPEDFRKKRMDEIRKRAETKIFPIIFRVPSINETVTIPSTLESLSNLSSGLTSHAPYTFSNEQLDLALISLDARDSEFADSLESVGFEPIPSTDIAEGPDAEGQELSAIGFPSSTALIAQIPRLPGWSSMSSDHVSLPISSFGRVAMLHPALSFFWADISIYPGNSGGPVIANDRLVGIVSAQATLAIDDVPHVHTRIPFGRIIKAEYVHTLLKEQIEKDKDPFESIERFIREQSS